MGVGRERGFFRVFGLLPRRLCFSFCGGVRDRVILLKSWAGKRTRVVRRERVDRMMKVM